MRKCKHITDDVRLSYLEEYMSSDQSLNSFEKKKGLSHNSIKNWLRTFGLEDKPTQMLMKSKDPSKRELEEEVLALKKRIRSLELELKHSNMSRDVYDCMIDLAEKKYNIPVRKNFDAK